MYGQRGARPEHQYYCCHNRSAPKQKRTSKGRKRGPLPYIRSDQLDDFFFRYTARVLREPELLLDQAFSEDSQSQQLHELKKKKEVCESKRDRHQSRLDRLINLYADGKYDRATLDHKMEGVQKQLEKAAREAQRVNSEMEQIERGKAQQKLEELKKHGFGTFLEQTADQVGFDEKRRFLGNFFQSSNDYIALSGSSGTSKASGSRRSMFNFNLLKLTAEKVKSGRPLGEDLDLAERERVWLTDEWFRTS